jgi:thioredoxin reductase
VPYDVVIVGGGPAGLSAALALGRARKRVLVCDAGARRNAAATHIHNFVTRDGTPPEDFRAAGRRELATYPSVEVRDTRVEAITGARGSFEVALGATRVEARRVLLCTGMIDETLPLEGFRELWGRSIFQCPYCHGWEAQGKRWGHLAHSPEALHFPMMLRGWTRSVVVFTNGSFEIPEDTRARFEAAGLRIEDRRVERLVSREGELVGLAVEGGEVVPCEVLYAHPPQRHVDVVTALGLTLDEHGCVQTHPMTRETSIPGIYAAGDLMTRMQGAILAAANGTAAAAMINHELTAELAVAGLL